MKKKFKILAAVVALALCAMALGACAEVENGSKIQRLNVELEFYNANGDVVDSDTVVFKLYTTYAPNTTAHIVELVESGYYNGVCVSNVKSGWFEFGGYKMENDVLTKVDSDVKAIEGEFASNGIIGNPTTVAAGSLILKRDYDDNTNPLDKYDTGKSTIIVALSSVSAFDSNKYCVFGVVENNDAPESASSSASVSASTSTSVDLTTLSSLGVCRTLTNYMSDDDGVTTYYYEKTGTYYTYYQDEEGDAHYYEGAEVDDPSKELFGADLRAVRDILSNEANYVLTVPYTKIIIKSITVSK